MQHPEIMQCAFPYLGKRDRMPRNVNSVKYFFLIPSVAWTGEKIDFDKINIVPSISILMDASEIKFSCLFCEGFKLALVYVTGNTLVIHVDRKSPALWWKDFSCVDHTNVTWCFLCCRAYSCDFIYPLEIEFQVTIPKSSCFYLFDWLISIGCLKLHSWNYVALLQNASPKLVGLIFQCLILEYEAGKLVLGMCTILASVCFIRICAQLLNNWVLLE